MRAPFQWQLRGIGPARRQPAVRSYVNIAGAHFWAAVFAAVTARAARGVVNVQASAVVTEVAAVSWVGCKARISD